MLYDAARLVDAGKGDGVLDHLVKPFVSEMAVEVARECVTLHGGRGYQRSEGIEIYLRDAVGCLIGESTTDMHYSTAAYLMDLPGAQPGTPEPKHLSLLPLAGATRYGASPARRLTLVPHVGSPAQVLKT